jgi:hypothetical protein
VLRGRSERVPRMQAHRADGLVDAKAARAAWQMSQLPRLSGSVRMHVLDQTWSNRREPSDGLRRDGWVERP